MLCGRSKSSERAGVQNWVGKIAASTFPQGRDVVENIFVRFNVITCYFISLSFSPRWHVVLLYSKEYPKYKHNLLLPF